MGPRTFAILWELLCYNWSPVYGWSAWQLYTGSNGDILQMNICHTISFRSVAARIPNSTQVTAELCLCRIHSNTQSQVWFSLLWKSLTHSLGPGVHKVLFVPSEHLWLVWDLTLNVTVPLLSSCWGFSFALVCGVSFFGGIQHFPVNGCLATVWDFGVLAGKMSVHPFTLPSWTSLLLDSNYKRKKQKWKSISYPHWKLILFLKSELRVICLKESK